MIIVFRFDFRYNQRGRLIVKEGLKCEDNMILRPLMEGLRVSATFVRMNWVQVRQSVRPGRTVSCLGTNMKEDATCEHCMDHSIEPRFREYLFEVANALLTVPRPVRNLAGNPILLQLETTEEVSRVSSTHRKGYDNDETDT